MNNTQYRLDFGDFIISVISDGYISVPNGIPDNRGPAGINQGHEDMDISCLLIKIGLHNILIDTGCGSGFQNTAGKLVQNLEKSGTSPDEIDTIIYTHGHEDHVGGTFNANGNPVFPNARYIVSRKEWECWERKPDTPLNKGLFASARKNLLQIRDKFELVEDNQEVFPGLSLLPARGHTFGSVIIQINSGKEKLLCIGDLIHSQTEFIKPGAYSFLDSDPEAAMKLRTEGLAKIAESGSLIHACHFPFPGAGNIVKKDGKLSWRPLGN
jgi:glyoxylase-like metal-dependent hydrolase (beta-lactamase superfamily II)